MRIVVAIHDPPVWSIPAREVERLAAALGKDEVIDARDAVARLGALPLADVLFATRMTAQEFACARKLTWVHSSAVGMGALLVPALVRSSIPVSNSRGIHSDAIAEHAIALALALRRSLHLAVARQAERHWAQEEFASRRIPTLAESQLLVVGLGSIGARIAALGAGLGMRVTGVRRRISLPVPAGVTAVLPPERLRDGLRRADVVILALPRTEQTRSLVGEEELNAMKPSAILVNIARGRLIDEGALVRALEAGRIAGAGLDAFQEEPLPPDNPLWRLPNVLISPHTAAFAGDYWAPVVDLFLENLGRFRRGEPLLNLVDKQAGY